MLPKIPKLITFFTVAGVMGLSLMYGPEGRAFDFGDMMNPGKWMGGGNDRYDDDYGGGGPWGGPYGAGGPGGPWGGPYGGGGPWGGYGPGPYGGAPYAPPGYYGAPGRPGAATVPAPAAPAPAAKAPAPDNSEIEALQRRIEELESQRQQPTAPPPSSGDWSSAPPPSGDWTAPPPAKGWGSPRSSGDSGKPSPNDWGSAPAFRPMGKN